MSVLYPYISWLSYPGFRSIVVAGTVWRLWAFLLLGLGASGLLPPTPLTEAVAYWPQGPITPGWLIPE